MRKFFVLALLGLALAGGLVAFASIEKPTSALACTTNDC